MPLAAVACRRKGNGMSKNQCGKAKLYAVNWHFAVDSGAQCRQLQGKLMYLVHNTDFIVARRPAAALVTMTCLAETMQHVCSRLVGVELC
jgi:hypothetical protein